MKCMRDDLATLDLTHLICKIGRILEAEKRGGGEREDGQGVIAPRSHSDSQNLHRGRTEKKKKKGKKKRGLGTQQWTKEREDSSRCFTAPEDFLLGLQITAWVKLHPGLPRYELMNSEEGVCTRSLFFPRM